MTYTLLHVRDMLRNAPDQVGNIQLRKGDCADMADAIDAHLSQPQHVAQGEAVACKHPRATEHPKGYTFICDTCGKEIV